MFFSSKKGVSMAPETLVKLILLTAFLLTIIILVIMVRGNLSEQSAKKYSCWLSSSVKASDAFIKAVFPDTCSVMVLDDAVDTKGLSILLRDMWWVYGEGKSDMAITAHEIYEAAQFKVSEEIGTEELLKYLLSHRKGKASSIERSDYNYLQKDAVGFTVCFDSNFREDDLKFKLDQDYHLYFADYIGILTAPLPVAASDKLIIMRELKPRSFWASENTFFCYNPLTEIANEGKILQEYDLVFGGGWTG